MDISSARHSQAMPLQALECLILRSLPASPSACRRGGPIDAQASIPEANSSVSRVGRQRYCLRLPLAVPALESRFSAVDGSARLYEGDGHLHPFTSRSTRELLRRQIAQRQNYQGESSRANSAPESVAYTAGTSRCKASGLSAAGSLVAEHGDGGSGTKWSMSTSGVALLSFVAGQSRASRVSRGGSFILTVGTEAMVHAQAVRIYNQNLVGTLISTKAATPDASQMRTKTISSKTFAIDITARQLRCRSITTAKSVRLWRLDCRLCDSSYSVRRADGRSTWYHRSERPRRAHVQFNA